MERGTYQKIYRSEQFFQVDTAFRIEEANPIIPLNLAGVASTVFAEHLLVMQFSTMWTMLDFETCNIPGPFGSFEIVSHMASWPAGQRL